MPLPMQQQQQPQQQMQQILPQTQNLPSSQLNNLPPSMNPSSSFNAMNAINQILNSMTPDQLFTLVSQFKVFHLIIATIIVLHNYNSLYFLMQLLATTNADQAKIYFK